jgi:hypothetical protein
MAKFDGNPRSIAKWKLTEFPETFDLEFSKILYYSENQIIIVGGSSQRDFRGNFPDG